MPSGDDARKVPTMPQRRKCSRVRTFVVLARGAYSLEPHAVRCDLSYISHMVRLKTAQTTNI